MLRTMAMMLGLLLSITGNLYAQQNEISAYNRLSPDDRLFTPPALSTSLYYTILLGKGNRLKIELDNGDDLRNFENIDSILMVFLGDMKAFRDSLADPMTVKRIDYLIDTTGQKKMRIVQSRPPGTTFLLDGGEPALLKLQQDTVYIMMVTRAPFQGKRENAGRLRYNRLCFFLNKYGDLESYVTTGLNDKIRGMVANKQIPAHSTSNHPFDYIVEEPTINPYPHDRNALEISPTVAVQNYKNYFSPSFALGATVVLKQVRNEEYRLGAFWEPLFLFAPDAHGQLHTYRNDFVVFSYEHNHLDGSRDKDRAKETLSLDPAFSLGYLVHSQGSFFKNPSFRLTAGAGEFLHGTIRLEPCIYFDHFFKGVTPGIRLSFGGF